MYQQNKANIRGSRIGKSSWRLNFGGLFKICLLFFFFSLLFGLSLHAINSVGYVMTYPMTMVIGDLPYYLSTGS